MKSRRRSGQLSRELAASPRGSLGNVVPPLHAAYGSDPGTDSEGLPAARSPRPRRGGDGPGWTTEPTPAQGHTHTHREQRHR